MTESRKEKLAGALVSLPTFTDNNLNLDVTKQRKHIRWLVDQGIVGDAGVIMVAGGYGEGYYLNDTELYTLIDVLMDEVGGKIPTMVGIFDLNVRKVARRAKYAADAGIDFLELGLPHYSCPSEDDVFIFTKFINDNVDISGNLICGGTGTFTGDLIAFSSSDETLKENLVAIPNALTKVGLMTGYTYDWKAAKYNDTDHLTVVGESDTGVIAQQVAALGLPGITTTREDGTMAVRYERLVPLLIEAIKELEARVKTLEG